MNYDKPAATAAKSLQSCPTLCDPTDGSSPGSPVPGIFQARTLEWVAISFSKAWKWKVKVKSLSRVWLLATPWTVAYQVPASMGFSRQEYWSAVPLPSSMTNLDKPVYKKQSHPFANKDPYRQSYGFSMYRCESWAIKNAECQRLILSNSAREVSRLQEDQTSQS